jgi:hypothetical protein
MQPCRRRVVLQCPVGHARAPQMHCRAALRTGAGPPQILDVAYRVTFNAYACRQYEPSARARSCNGEGESEGELVMA